MRQIKELPKVEPLVSWKKFSNFISLENNPNESWRKIKNFLKPKGQRDYPALHHANKIAKTNADKAQLFPESVERHFGIESNHFDSNHFDEVKTFIEDNHRYFYPPEDPDHYRSDVGNEHELVADVDAQTLIKLVKFLKRGKAPGPDTIHNEVLRLGTTTSLFHHLARIFTRKTELNLKLYGETLKIYPQAKFPGITFDSQLNFKKHFEEILDYCNTRYHRLRLLINKKWGPSPATIIQIYKQCVRPIFEYGSLSTITASDYIISKIQWLQNKFIRLALRLPKYICSKLLHDSTGLPYVKDRLLSCATKSLDRLAQNPLVEESISSNRLNPAWDPLATPLSVVRPVSP